MPLLVFQVGYTASGAAQETDEPDSLRPYWTGRIEQDTTWRDTVYVGGDVTIASGVTLTLAPDTKVHFLPYRDDTQGGLDSTRAELIVEGRLHAQAGGIVFCSADASSLGADWYGLVVERGGLADVSHAVIRDGLRCLYAKRGGRVTMDHISFANCGKPTAQSLSQRSAASDSTQVAAGRAGGQRQLRVQPAQAEPEAARSDSLSEKMEAMVKRYYMKADKREGGGLRMLKKGIAGTFSGIAFTLIALGVHDKIWEPSGGPDGAVGAVGVLLYVGGIGWSVGFPLGVSSVDPYDSLPKTLLAGVIPGAVGIGLLLNDFETGFEMVYVVPVISSLMASELWRKPPQDRRVSFGFAPIPNGGLSAVSTLHF
ncbi:MAG: hypothetical protein J4F35_04225 [Candidatus Latescibacteria bacterium]|nr:hypothetical protein [Candidatus Latescibacterota bacterium]